MTTYSDRARRIGDDLVALVQDHERREHDGERCPAETVNMLAYLAHRLGVHSIADAPEDAIRLFLERVRDYAAIHEEHTP